MLDVSEIQKFIENDLVSEKKKFAGIGQKYYEGEHDIRKYRLFYYNADGKFVEDQVRSNVKISHPFFTELADQLSAYMLSFKETPVQAKDTADGLQDFLDLYFDDDFWSEVSDVVTGAYTKANKLEKRLRRLLKQLIKVVLDEINFMNGTGYQITDVKMKFDRSIMTNESENVTNEKTEADTQQVRVNTILNIAEQIGDEQTLKALCDVMDWDYEELKDQVQKEGNTASDARKALEQVIPEDVGTE